jgi:hypothetical protein
VNLNAIVSGAIGTVNPRITVAVQISTGYVTGSDGKRTPSYAKAISLIAQWQPIQYNDIVMADSMNIQGTRRKVWLNGKVDGLVRSANQGGDLITTSDGEVWKIAFISEQWTENTMGPNWVSAVVTLQNVALASTGPDGLSLVNVSSTDSVPAGG